MQKKNVERKQKAVDIVKKYNLIDTVTETICGCIQKEKKDFVAVYGFKIDIDSFGISTKYPVHYRVFEDGTVCMRQATEMFKYKVGQKLKYKEFDVRVKERITEESGAGYYVVVPAWEGAIAVEREIPKDVLEANAVLNEQEENND